MGNLLRSLSCASHPYSRIPSGERQALESVSKGFFQKYSGGPPSELVSVRTDELKYWQDFIKESLEKGSLKKGAVPDTKQPAYNETKVQLLNTSNTTPAKIFLDQLDKLLKKSLIETRMLKSSSDVSKLDKIYIIVCNKTDNETAKQAVDKSLHDIEDIHYKRIVLIVLHVTRLQPRTSTRDELKSEEDALGKYSEIGSIVDMFFQLENGIYRCKANENALNEIKDFCSERFAINPGENAATAGTSMQPTYTSPSDQLLSYCEEKKEECPTYTAYIINPSGSPAAKRFVSEFQQKTRKYSIEISETQESDVEKLDPDAVLILVCNNISRIDTDIDRSLSAISEKRYGKTILIILHVRSNDRNSRNLQRMTPRTSCEMYARILGMIDMSFTIDKGIYDCKMNTKAFNELKEIYDTTYGAVKTGQKEIDIPEDFSENSSDQKTASNNTVPTKKTKTGDEQENAENSLEEPPPVSTESELFFCY